ncbi:alpha/beta hydrolase [Parahaliea maris]|uniref:Alpha/beta hydrolase n=1 Tax=Parahaliea maris TaxID=2716870 RepID=A0A5C8ZWP0_9GAMM|nr:alpha/beta fold hydrolase [Parahaliea maris]TXS91980.1 alpha/beta hydrolase [Parahaliea maris]
MNDRRQFLKQGVSGAAMLAAAGGTIASGNASASDANSVYDGVMGRGYARGPHGLVHFHDSAGLVDDAENKVPLVLLHQSPASARQFESAFGPLVERGVRFVAIDTPGFGFSDPTPFVPKIQDWTSSIIAVLDHLGIEQADVLGHHTGSLIATEVALQSPSRVRRLILNGPFPASEAERQKMIDREEQGLEKGKPKLDGSHLTSSFAVRVRMGGENPDPAIITRIVVEKFQGLGPYTWGHHAAYRYDHASSLKKVRQPTLILTNTGDMLYDLAHRTQEMRPDFAFVELEGGTQDIVDQQPEAWSDAVVAYLVSGQ